MCHEHCTRLNQEANNTNAVMMLTEVATHLYVPQWYVANYGFDCSALSVGFTRHRAVLRLQKSSVTFDVSIFCGE